MKRVDVLDTAKAAVMTDRNTSYGEPEDNFGLIAALWTPTFGRLFAKHEVALALGLVKVARLALNPTHDDSWVDMAGYAACGSEVAVEVTDPPEDRREYLAGYAEALKDVAAWNKRGDRLKFDDTRFRDGYQACRQDLDAYCHYAAKFRAGVDQGE